MVELAFSGGGWESCRVHTAAHNEGQQPGNVLASSADSVLAVLSSSTGVAVCVPGTLSTDMLVEVVALPLATLHTPCPPQFAGAECATSDADVDADMSTA
jgi:hypothetical protein